MTKLGTGYSSDRQLSLNTTCLKFFNVDDVELTGSPQSVVRFNALSSYTETARELDVDLSVKARIHIPFHTFTMQGSIDYAHYTKETDYTKSFIFNLHAQAPSRLLKISSYGPLMLTDTAFAIYSRSIKEFVAICGDQFVLQEALGASLYLNVKLEFATKTEKDSFSINTDWVLGAVMAFLSLDTLALKALLDKNSQKDRVSLSMAVLQKGGNITILKNQLPELNLNDSGMATLNCVRPGSNATAGLAFCGGIMNKLFDYIANGFPDSFKDFKLFEVLNTYKISYDDIGIDATSLVPQYVLNIRKHLKALYVKLENEQTFLIKLLSSFPNKYMNISGIGVGWDYTSINPATLEKLKALNQTLTTSIKTTIAKDDICYDDIDRCQDFDPAIDMGLIEHFKTSYIIKSKCGDFIYEPKYMLAIDTDTYLEDSIVPVPYQNTTSLIIANYAVENLNDHNITVVLNSTLLCSYVLLRDANYPLIQAYNGQLSGQCASIVCPLGAQEGSSEVEFILTKTPI